MISYKPFYRTLLAQNKTEYELIFKEGISAHTLHRMTTGLPITTRTIDTLCFVLNWVNMCCGRKGSGVA